MPKFLGRLISIIAVIAFWGLTVMKFTLQAIGYSTIAEDAKGAPDNYEKLLLAVLNFNGTLLLSASLIATLWLMWVSWPGAQFPTFRWRNRKFDGYGDRLLDIAKRLRIILDGVRKGGDHNEDFGVWAELRTCYVALDKCGMKVPWVWFKEGDRILWCYRNATYCEGVGALLKDGHVQEALEVASQMEDALRFGAPSPQSPPSIAPKTQP